MKELFKSKCNALEQKLHSLWDMLNILSSRIVSSDFASELNVDIKPNSTLITDKIDGIEEIVLDGETVTLIDRKRDKYRSYVVYTKRGYHTMGLGIEYKGKVISPHISDGADCIITEYNDEELKEIIELIEKYISDIDKDIAFLQGNSSVDSHPHYYGEYNSGFESHNRFNNLADVVNDFIKL